MKNVPDTIYLQIDADGETPQDFNELHQVSWCSNKINDNDIKYILASSVKAKEKGVCPFCGSDDIYFSNKYKGYIHCAHCRNTGTPEEG